MSDPVQRTKLVKASGYNSEACESVKRGWPTSGLEDGPREGRHFQRSLAGGTSVYRPGGHSRVRLVQFGLVSRCSRNGNPGSQPKP